MEACETRTPSVSRHTLLHCSRVVYKGTMLIWNRAAQVSNQLDRVKDTLTSRYAYRMVASVVHPREQLPVVVVPVLAFAPRGPAPRRGSAACAAGAPRALPRLLQLPLRTRAVRTGSSSERKENKIKFRFKMRFIISKRWLWTSHRRHSSAAVGPTRLADHRSVVGPSGARGGASANPVPE